MPIAQMLDEHDQKGFAFYPHEWELVKGEKTFGVTTVSLEYLKQAFHGLEVSCVEWSEIDPLQMIVFLRKQKKQ
jgi:hypothetical protein